MIHYYASEINVGTVQTESNQIAISLASITVGDILRHFYGTKVLWICKYGAVFMLIEQIPFISELYILGQYSSNYFLFMQYL